MAYWEGSPEQWDAITRVQAAKRSITGATGMDAIYGDRNVITNPVTGQAVPIEDLKYAAAHMREIYESGMIREDRWAFLWYHG
jgi:hypothetical protein